MVNAYCFAAFERLVLKELKTLKNSVTNLGGETNAKLNRLLLKVGGTQIPPDMAGDLVLLLKTEYEVGEIEGHLN